MAHLLQAIQAYGPRIQLNQTADLSDVADWISMRSSMNTGEIKAILQELSDCILFFNRRGTPVKLDQIGTFTPSVKRAGVRKINIRMDMSLKNGINEDNKFTAQIVNRNNIDLTDEDYKALWDADHPDDPLEI